MIIVIDAYNVLKSAIGRSTVTETERQAFIAKMSKYAQLKEHEIIIVFDGGPYDHPTLVKKGQTRVVYSGRNENADEYIKEFTQANSNRDLLIVTSDRVLRNFVKSMSVSNMKAMDFYILIEKLFNKSKSKIVKPQGQIRKLHVDEDNPELDALMQEASKAIVDKDKFIKNIYSSKQNEGHDRLSKEEKKALKIIKKLS